MQSKYVLKKGFSGDLVNVLQELLKITQDGIFGVVTERAVIAFQRASKFNLTPDGIVGPMTWKQLDYNPLELEADSDLTTGATWIQQYRLPEGEYVKKETPKEWIFLHHTAGRSNPKSTIDHWASDQRGRVGTHYVIGGVPSNLDLDNLTEEDSEWDGKILQAIADEYWAYHLGAVKSSAMHRNSISIEICSAGYLTEKDDKFYTWYGQEVHVSQVARLESEFKGHRYYHKYSPKQLDAVKALLLLLSNKHGINLNEGISAYLKMNKTVYINPSIAFSYKEECNYGKIKGVLTHGMVRKDKSDIFPQKELVDILWRNH